MKRSNDKPLSPEAAHLVRSGRQRLSEVPTQADLERNFSVIQTRIVQGALPDVSQVPDPGVLAPTTATQGSMWGWVIAATLGAGVLGGLYLTSKEHVSTPMTSRGAQVAPDVSKSAPLERTAPPAGKSDAPIFPLTSSDAPAVSSAVASVPKNLPTPPPQLSISSQSFADPSASSDELAQEVALLSAATTALRAGRAQETLNLLHQHQTRFPRGALSQERRSAQTEALCLLGNRPAAEAVLRTLSPSSPLTARAKRACNLE